MKNKVLYLSLIIIIIVLGVTFTIIHKNNNKCEIQSSYCFYDESEQYILVEKNIVNNITSYLYKDKTDEYLSKMYNHDNEISINDLIKEDKINEYNEKIKTLLYSKYPKFISDALSGEDVKKSYLLRDNELVIYFNNYVITPEISEVLYLKVNYNEIKDYLNLTVILDKEYQNESGYDYSLSKKSVAITFDDSPNNMKTDAILNILKDNYAHATFFVMGEKAIYQKDLLIKMINNGNEIGSHSYSHQNLKKMSKEEVINDFNLVNNIYYNLFQKDIKLLRPPYGSYKKEQLSYLPVSFILWSLDTNDWRYRNSDYLINYVINNIEDGDIILFHDSYESTVNAIEELLPILYSKGYQVMSVSELFNLRGKTLNINEAYYNVK